MLESDLTKILGSFSAIIEMAATCGVNEANLKFLRSSYGIETFKTMAFQVRNEMLIAELEAFGILGICHMYSMRSVARDWKLTPKEWALIERQYGSHGPSFSRRLLFKCALENENNEAKWTLVYLPGQTINQQIVRLSENNNAVDFSKYFVIDEVVKNVLRKNERDLLPMFRIQHRAVGPGDYALIDFMPKENPLDGVKCKRVTPHRMVEAILSCKMACGQALDLTDFCVCSEQGTNIIIRSQPPGTSQSAYVCFETDEVASLVQFSQLQLKYPSAQFGPCWEVDGIQ